MQDFLGKELVCSYDYSDFNESRNHTTQEIINGRVWLKTGKYTSTAFVGDVYKLDVSSDEPFKFILLIGLSRQHPNERQASRKEGVEVAAVNAKFTPFASMRFMNVPTYDDFRTICETYLKTIPYQFVRTKEEENELKWDKIVTDLAKKIKIFKTTF